jgi:GT2 family glycosyltransferase
VSERLYLLLPVHNRRAVTLRFAQALARQTDSDFVLVLIDDGSVDATAKAVCECLPQSVVLQGEGDWWWAGCLQQGYRWLMDQDLRDEDMIGILNDDIEIEPDFIATARSELSGCPDTLLLARHYDAISGREHAAGGGVHVDVNRAQFSVSSPEAPLNCLPTRGLFLSWSSFVRIGGLRPRWLPHYFSDYEFTWRAGQRGLRLRVATTAKLWCHVQTTGSSGEDILARPRSERLSLVFSRRFKGNPRAWIAFAWLTAPWHRLLIVTARILAHSIWLCLMPSRPAKRAE